MNRFRAALLSAAFLLMWSANILSAQTIQIPTRVSTDDIFGYRLQNFANDAAPGIYTGVPDLTLDDGRSTLRYVQWTPGDNEVVITYDANGEGMLSVAVVNGNGLNYYTTYTNIGGAVDYFKARPITDVNGLTLAIGVQDPGVVLTLKQFTVDGTNLGDLVGGEGTTSWSIGDVTVNDGFTITTTLNIAGDVSLAPATCTIDLFGSVLPAGPPPTAYLAPCALQTSPEQFGWRFRSFGNTAEKELYAGIPDLNTAANRADADAIWTQGNNAVMMVYNSTTHTLQTTVTNANGTVSTTYAGVGAAVAPNVLTISVAALDAGVTIALNDLLVDGASIVPLASTGGTTSWSILGIDFTDGLTISANVNIAGTVSAVPENCVVNIMAGMIGPSSMFSVAECVNMIKPCTMSSVTASAPPTFDATVVIPKRVVVGTRTDGRPGAWLIYQDCTAQEMTDGGYALPEVTEFPSTIGWEYSVQSISADGKWAAGCATMRNNDAADGYTAGYQYPVQAARNQWIRIPNGTVVGIKWQFIAGSGSGTIAMAVPASIGDPDVRTATNGFSVAVGSSVPFCPSTIVTTTFGDYMGLSGTQACMIETVPGGDKTFFTFAGGVWANRPYNLKALRPTNALYVTSVIPIQYFGPQRNTTPCNWYVVGFATGVATNGEGGLWQIRHQSATNQLRYDYVIGGTNERLPDLTGVLERKDGWTIMFDDSKSAVYTPATQNTTLYGYAVNTLGNKKNPFTNGYEIAAGTTINLIYSLNVGLNAGDNCNGIHTQRVVDCVKPLITPKKSFIVRCDDAKPVFGGHQESVVEDTDPVAGYGQGGEVAVYPNPAYGRTTIETEGMNLSAAMVTIVDATGRTVAVEVQETSGTLTFDAAALAPGLYVVRVDAGDRPRISSFVVR
jgi:hypothetical protein